MRERNPFILADLIRIRADEKPMEAIEAIGSGDDEENHGIKRPVFVDARALFE